MRKQPVIKAFAQAFCMACYDFSSLWTVWTQGHPPQATLTLARVSRTGLIPGLLRSSLLLPETLSLDCDSAFMQALGEGVWKASLTGKWMCF